MSGVLPSGEFQWVDPATFKYNWQNIAEDFPWGYFVECDLEYPPELHELHNDYPLAPERVNIEVEMLSETQLAISPHYNRTRTRENVKLVPNLMKKTRYTCHYLLLRFYLDHGMRLTKVHRIIQFRQSAWMLPYIAMNTWLRMKAGNDMEKDFHKLMNNAVYGKTCENQRKRSDIRLVTERDKAEKLVDKPHCLDVRIFDENLVGIEMRKVKLLLNKPSYIGFAVLELSKLLMLRFSSLFSFLFSCLLRAYRILLFFFNSCSQNQSPLTVDFTMDI